MKKGCVSRSNSHSNCTNVCMCGQLALVPTQVPQIMYKYTVGRKIFAVKNICGRTIAMYLQNNSWNKFSQMLAMWLAYAQCCNDYFANNIFVVFHVLENLPSYGSIFLGLQSIHCLLHKVMLTTTPLLVPLSRVSCCSLTVGASSFLRFTCERNDSAWKSNGVIKLDVIC